MKQKLLSILALLLMTATGAWAQKDTPLTLEAKASGQIVVENPPVGMQYKKNDEDKKTITEDGDYDAGSKRLNLNVNNGDKVQFFGKGTSITSYSGTKIGSGYTGCYIYGNIMSLVDEENFATATELTDDNTFKELFKGCTNLYSHSTNKLVLPATTLTENCYRYMFFNCENLTVAPELPATTLADDCYESMFDGCTSLTTAPALPATTLAEYCYYCMFYGCTSLTVAPELPATTLAYGCYANMFSGCTSLTTAPALPATTLETRCYNNMFKGCTKLNSVTCLATNISASNATYNWLSGVAATGTFTKAAGMTDWELDNASGIPAGWTVVLPDMKKTPLTLEAKTAGTIVVSKPQSGMQYSKNGGVKTELTTDAGYNSSDEKWTITVAIGDKVQFYGNGTSIASYSGTNIYGGTADCYIYGNIMSLVDEENFATATELTGYSAFGDLFSGNSNLYNHPTNKLVLPATTLADDCYYFMFASCTNLTTAPELPATTLADYCYNYMFYGCTSLTTAPELPATTLADDCYANMFLSCTNLTTAPALPATTLAGACYSGMFAYCTNLTTAPVLPATTLADYCYSNMFKGCTKLNSVTCLATDISASEATTAWLDGVAADGTFTKAAGMTGWTTGESGIPSGWTVVDVDNVVLTDGSDPSALKAYAGQLCAVTYSRAFTADKPSTVCLPFAYTKKTGEKFYTFTDITKEGGNYVATMTEHAGATLVANTPYLYKSAATGDTDFSGTYTIPATISAAETTSGDWTFVGTYDTKEWTTAPTGIYGFSAQNTVGGISQGEFVKVGAYVKVKPMRAYLKYKDGEDYAGARSMDRAASSETLPETISVRLIDAEGNVTGIGTLETRTGEVRFDPEAWYTLNGVRLSGQPTQKGIYVNNGKKVIIK